MTTKAPPAVNLKERIAALQQRNVTPPSQRTSSTSPPATSPNASPSSANALRDKIAKFEKRGGVPIPRGSFGLGAPPPAENGQSKRRGELYGNRLASQVTGGSFALSTHQTGGAFPPSAMNMGNNSLNSRRFSMSQVEMEGTFDQLPQSMAAPPTKEADADEPIRTQLSPNRPSLSVQREPVQRSVSSSGILERSSTNDAPANPIMTDGPMVQEPVEQFPAIVVSSDGPSVTTAEMPVEASCAISNDATVAKLPLEPEQTSSSSAPPPVLVHEPTPINSATPPTTSAPEPSTISPPETKAQPLNTVKPAESQTVSSPSANPVEPITQTGQTEKKELSSSSRSQLRPQTTYVPEPDFDPFSYIENNPNKTTFSATVHRKTMESPPRTKVATTARATIMVTPKPDTGKVPASSQTPTSPGFGELSMLVNQAVTLEALLDDAPTPAPEPASSAPLTDTEKSTPETRKRVESKSSKSSLRRKRSMGGNSLKKSKAAAAAAAAQVEPPVPVPAVPTIPILTEPFVPPPLDPRPKRSIARDLVLDGESSTPLTPPSSYISPDSRKSTTAREANKSTESIPPTPPPKSPGKSRYFASLRRLGNSSSHSPPSATAATAAPRGSQSFTTYLVTKDDSISSAEDSPAIVTPIDHADSGSTLGQPRESRDGRPGSIYNVNWPGKSVSNSIMRASSFAEKMWHRTRTRSTTSTTGGKLTSPSAHSLAEPMLLPPVQTLEPLYADDSTPKPTATSVLPPPRTSSLSPHTEAPPPTLLSPPPQLPSLSSGLLDQTFESSSSPLLDMSMFDSLSSSPKGL